MLTDYVNMEHIKNAIDNDINHDEICHPTSKPITGSSVQTKDFMSEKSCRMLPHYLIVSSWRRDNQILIESLHLDKMRVKRKCEADGTFLLYDVYMGA